MKVNIKICEKYLADEVAFMSLQGGKVSAEILDVARKNNCDYIIAGCLTNCNLTKMERLFQKTDGIHIDISVRVIDTKTNKVVFITTGEGSSGATVTRMGRLFRFGELNVSEIFLDEALQDAIKKVVAKMEKAI